MTLPRGLGFEGEGANKRAVPVELPPSSFFDDAPAPVETTFAEAVELLRWTCTVLAGPDKSAHIRTGALARVAGLDRTSLREAARKLHCSPDTLSRAMYAIQTGLKSNAFTRGKKPKKSDAPACIGDNSSR